MAATRLCAAPRAGVARDARRVCGARPAGAGVTPAHGPASSRAAGVRRSARGAPPAAACCSLSAAGDPAVVAFSRRAASQARGARHAGSRGAALCCSGAASEARRSPPVAPESTRKHLLLLRVALLSALVACVALVLPLAAPQSAAAAKAGVAPAVLPQEASFVRQLVSFVVHLDKHLAALVAASKARTYAVLFAIVFAETGLVVTPFLPGDSLLFAAGALAALGSLSLPLLMGLLFAAAVAGDTVNYAAGKWLGAAAFTAYPSVFRAEYLDKTRAFFAKHGPKTIVLARFVPIVRTFAPFVAGVGTMAYPTFVFYNVAGAAVWVLTFCVAGFALGNVPAVRHNFALVTVGIVLVSLLPVAHELLEARRQHTAAQQ